MKKCGFKIETQESRNYEYGPDKEFETKEEAIEFAEKILSNVKTQIALAKCWTLYDSSKIIEEEGLVRIKVDLKSPIINF